MEEKITPEMLLQAYANGFFPMGDSREGEELFWYQPKKRGVIPLDGFHAPKSLLKLARKGEFEIRVSEHFPQVIAACAEVEGNLKRKQAESWINDPIIGLYTQLWEMGFAHSIECWQDGALVGGLYGISLGGGFFGESMFSRVPNASRVALLHLVARLKAAGYGLLDTQYVNKHLQQFGAVEVPHRDYMALLEKALKVSPNPSSRFLSVSPESI